MRKKRAKNEIESNPFHIIVNPETYRAIHGYYEENFRTSEASLLLTLEQHQKGKVVKLKFFNVGLNTPVFCAIRDSCGFYFLDTSYLGWSSNQRIEVGDTDGGPPLFWAETVRKII